MDGSIAWKLVKKYTNKAKLSESERILYEEALYFIVYSEIEDIYMAWDGTVIAGAFNLGSYYEGIGKSELAQKYFSISRTYEKYTEENG